MLVPSLFASALLWTQDDFKPSPANKWAVEAVALGIREGVMPEFVYGIYRQNTRKFRSRYEFAVILHAGRTTQFNRLQDALAGRSTPVERASLLRARSLLPYYRRGEKEFAKEFRSLGIENGLDLQSLESLTNRLDRQSAEREHPFRDVPVDHWAAKALGDLRALGLIDGYPDGRFRP